MKQHQFAFSIAWIAALLVATPAMGQLFNFPVLAVAPGGADGSYTIGGGWARGLNDNSQKLNGFGVGIARNQEKVSFTLATGYVTELLPDVDEFTLAANAGLHLLESDSPAQVTLQVGIGWMQIDGTPDGTTLLQFPLGVALQTNNDGPARFWVMPRLNIFRQSTGGISDDTEYKFGTSLGGSYAAESGVGVGVALDWQMKDDGLGGNSSAIGFSIGLFYAMQ